MKTFGEHDSYGLWYYAYLILCAIIWRMGWHSRTVRALQYAQMLQYIQKTKKETEGRQNKIKTINTADREASVGTFCTKHR